MLACFWRDVVRNGLASDGGLWGRKTSIDCVFLNPEDYAWTSTTMRSYLLLTTRYHGHFYLICVLYVCVYHFNLWLCQSNTCTLFKELMLKGLWQKAVVLWLFACTPEETICNTCSCLFWYESLHFSGIFMHYSFGPAFLDIICWPVEVKVLAPTHTALCLHYPPIYSLLSLELNSYSVFSF